MLHKYIRLCNSINTLSNSKYLITHSTMQGLGLDNDERKETMDGYFMTTVEGGLLTRAAVRGKACLSIL